MPTPLTLRLKINGKPQPVSVADDTEPLLYVLRNDCNEKGPKLGCGVAQCGACTVLVDGAITRSCVKQIKTVTDGAEITTLDGLGNPGKLHPLQQAFVDQQAAQCATCINGMIMGSLGWLQGRIAAGNRNVPTDDEVKQFLSGVGQTPPLVYLCRCGAHARIISAIQQAAKEMK